MAAACDDIDHMLRARSMIDRATIASWQRRYADLASYAGAERVDVQDHIAHMTAMHARLLCDADARVSDLSSQLQLQRYRNDALDEILLATCAAGDAGSGSTLQDAIHRAEQAEARVRSSTADVDAARHQIQEMERVIATLTRQAQRNRASASTAVDPSEALTRMHHFVMQVDDMQARQEQQNRAMSAVSEDVQAGMVALAREADRGKQCEAAIQDIVRRCQDIADNLGCRVRRQEIVIDELNAEVEAARAEAHCLAGDAMRASRAEQNLLELQQDLDDLRQQRDQETEAGERARAACSREHDEREAVEARLQSALATIDRLRVEHDSHKAELSASLEHCAALEKEADEAGALVEDLRAEDARTIGELRDDVKALRSRAETAERAKRALQMGNTLEDDAENGNGNDSVDRERWQRLVKQVASTKKALKGRERESGRWRAMYEREVASRAVRPGAAQ
ncbi:unnamed protein product (mitochondrion) [Plasmodiophora brassicae]|uniref:Uncharacterized protein n=1 Tax=Plasmodiophora brassicae TaxID=37360 RepID=A0A3P3Y6H5_PLABS|nr:unnamed protein product [Plasmodiophora brassicae]